MLITPLLLACPQAVFWERRARGKAGASISFWLAQFLARAAVQTKRRACGQATLLLHSHSLDLTSLCLRFRSFNLEQRDVCKYRLKLLQYLDRLATYEVILGGVAYAHEEFSRQFFQRFRDTNIVQAAVEYARVRVWPLSPGQEMWQAINQGPVPQSPIGLILV